MASGIKASLLAYRLPFTREFAVTVGALIRVANAICVLPGVGRNSFAGVALQGWHLPSGIILAIFLANSRFITQFAALMAEGYTVNLNGKMLAT